MRVSVKPSDPGYRNFELGMRVLLDGKDITDGCITADEELGVAVCYVRDKDGVIDPLRETEILEGTVVVTKPPYKGSVEDCASP